MPATFSNLSFHIVFGTKERKKLLFGNLRERLCPYIAGIANRNDFKALITGGTDDHVHILLSLKPETPVSKATQLIKGGSSNQSSLRDFTIF